MDNNWRPPEGWKNPYSNYPVSLDPGCPKCREASVFEEGASTIIPAVEEATLKAVGEWLIAHKAGWWIDEQGKVTKVSSVFIPAGSIEAFLGGTFPEEVK